ncbi:MAG: hypothetical protein LN567_07220 [Rickettsia endosymbiont of Graphium doson]|nr:hypothetical protein [Rickettsia endosymbiont of Graphium doson]
MINIESLYKKPYALIPFSAKKAQIEEAIGSFFEFLKLPENIKQHIDLKISPLHRRGDIGFKHRNPEDDIYNDSKDFFHYHPIIEKHYSEFIKKHETLRIFLKNAALLWDIVYYTIKHILANFEKDYPNTLSKIFDTDTPHILLRFLKYDYSVSGQYLAKPHFDSGSFTIAIAESSPGLRIGTNPEDLEVVRHEENKAIFFISSNFRKIIDNELLKPAWHDVIQLDKSEIGKSFSRWAIVAFIDGHSVEALPRSETHKFFVNI